jgi:hypothetical protein
MAWRRGDINMMYCTYCVHKNLNTDGNRKYCDSGRYCKDKHNIEIEEDIPFKIEPLKTRFSEIGKTPLEIEIGVNLALKRGCKLIINNSTYTGFKCFRFDLSKHTINVFNNDVLAEIEYYEDSNIIVSYGRETVKLTIEVL